MLVEALLFIAVAIGIGFLVIQYLKTKPTFQGNKALYDLSVANQVVLPNSIAPWTAHPCSIRFAIFINSAPRTVAKVDCVEFPITGQATSLAPSCADYSFKTCACSTPACTNCILTSPSTGYMTKLLFIGDSLELWASGYTSQNDKPYVPALLKIRTSSDPSTFYMESISLPAIPLRKWTVLTIVKEGRRFDVYYGAKSVASKLCDYVPVPPSMGSQWYSGDPRWKGSIGLFAATQTVQTTDDVEKDVSSIVNSRGIPYYLEQFNFNVDFSIPECMFGNCNTLPTIKPTNPFAVYTSTVS